MTERGESALQQAAYSLYRALRLYPCRCHRVNDKEYRNKLVAQCGRCAAIEEYAAAMNTTKGHPASCESSGDETAGHRSGADGTVRGSAHAAGTPGPGVPGPGGPRLVVEVERFKRDGLYTHPHGFVRVSG